MASKKKSPSFEIPDAVRSAGQSGWVYRTDAEKASPSPPPEPEPASPAPDEEAGDRWTISTGVIGLGLHVAAVPLVMPLYVTAAISRKLGLLPR